MSITRPPCPLVLYHNAFEYFLEVIEKPPADFFPMMFSYFHKVPLPTSLLFPHPIVFRYYHYFPHENELDVDCQLDTKLYFRCYEKICFLLFNRNRIKKRIATKSYRIALMMIKNITFLFF